jgi:hypothetical protein
VDGWGVMCLIVGNPVWVYVLTPHVLSEGCLEWCSFICVVFWLRCVGLSWCSMSWADGWLFLFELVLGYWH